LPTTPTDSAAILAEILETVRNYGDAITELLRQQNFDIEIMLDTMCAEEAQAIKGRRSHQ